MDTNEDILELECDLGHAVEHVTLNIFCINELLDGRVGRLAPRREEGCYIHKWDIVALAEPKRLFSGIMLYNILDNNAVISIISSIDSFNKTIYYNDTYRFLSRRRNYGYM